LKGPCQQTSGCLTVQIDKCIQINLSYQLRQAGETKLYLLNFTVDPLNPEQLRVSTLGQYPCATHAGDDLWIPLTPVDNYLSFDPLTAHGAF